MSLSESRKRANAKWDRENMTVLSCKVTKATAEKFRDACRQRGMTTNGMLVRFVKETINETETPE